MSNVEYDQEQLQRVMAELLARTPENDVKVRLDPTRRACAFLGDPHEAYPVIHIAGTNGKTSVARFVERILREHNLRTGRITSPHLTSVTERVCIDGVPISATDFVRVYEDVSVYLELVDGELAAAGEPRLTYFEAMTVLSFAAFADAPVDVAIVETGLGGTWDATNIVDPAVSVITPIGLDHTHMLGTTYAEIASAKAGIIKPTRPVVMALQPPDAAQVIIQTAKEQQCPLWCEGVDFAVASRQVAVGGQMVDIRTATGEYEGCFIPLHGEYQAHNAAVAVASVEAFLGGGTQRLEPEVLMTALADLSAPGRMEVVRLDPVVIVDASHNPSGAEVTVDAVRESFRFRHLVGVVGMLGDKDPDTVLSTLEPILDEVVVTRSLSPRSIPVGALAEIAQDIFGEDRVHVADRLDNAIATGIDLAMAQGDHDTGVLITGSVTVAGEARILLRAGDPDPADTSAPRETWEQPVDAEDPAMQALMQAMGLADTGLDPSPGTSDDPHDDEKGER